MKRLLSALLLALLLSACGPMYETRYTFVPPKGSSGQACILQCENNRMQCEQLAEMRFQNCEDRADREYRDCEHEQVFGYDKKGRWTCVDNCYCWRDSCERDTDRCDALYRTCYQTCGGKVKAQTVCVANCDQQK